MMNSIQELNDSDLLLSTARLVEKDRGVTADLLLHLGEIDVRRLYLERAFPSMFAFCVGELGFSEDVAFNRIAVARLARRFPVVIDTVRSGSVHLSGLRLLAPHLTQDNHVEVLAEAATMSKREIEELVARLAPKPPVPNTIRKTPQSREMGQPVPPKPSARGPEKAVPSAEPPLLAPEPRSPAHVQRGGPLPSPRPLIQPLAEETFRVQFTASRAVRDKLREAQDLLRHQIPDGDIARIIERALDLLVDHVRKKRFAVGKKPRAAATEVEARRAAAHRHIPDAIKRAVYERDGGRCAFVDERGRRCEETGSLELDHIDGFARTGEHTVERIRLACRAHNRHLADKMYGREFMEAAITGAASRPTCAEKLQPNRPTRPGTCTQPLLL